MPSQGGNYLPVGLVVHLVPLLPLATGDEPVHVGPAVQSVDGVVVVHRGRGEAVRDVEPAGQGALEMLDAGAVGDVGAAPLLHDGQQRREIGVVVGGAPDQDGAAEGGPERVGPEAADEQVPAAAAPESV